MSTARPGFRRLDGNLYAENIALADLANRFGTPLFVYSRAYLESCWQAYDHAFGNMPHTICYAVKANANLGVLSCLARLGSGFDIVSGGELGRVLAAGGKAEAIVFSGVGKTREEMRQALSAGIGCFNVESAQELRRLDAEAQALGKRAPIALRVNPDVDAQTHPYIATGLRNNKFGIDIQHARETYALARDLPAIEPIGVACHIGSQLTSVTPLLDAAQRVLSLIDDLAADGIRLNHLDLGGGLGIRYHDEQPPAIAEYITALTPLIRHRKLTIAVEPGRSIVGNAGMLLTRVEYLKRNGDKQFAIVDAAMNDLPRPALYDAHHVIEPVSPPPANRNRQRLDIVGPICESGDFLARDRELAIQEGELLAIHSAGAYAFAMASNYNSRCRAAEVMVDGQHVHLVRRRESLYDLLQAEAVVA